jgi:exonuclease VII large subunit
MPKPNEQAQINFIIDCLRKGEQRKDILRKFKNNWEKVARSSFDRRLAKAKMQLQAELDEINAKLRQSMEQEAEKRKDKIMSFIERQEYLTKIVTCKTDLKKVGNNYFQILELEDGRKEVITLADKLKALAELNKMDGSYAPNRHELTAESKIQLPVVKIELNPSEEVLEIIKNQKQNKL